MQERLEAFRMYVEHHVLHHWGTMDAVTHSDWLSSLGHNALAIFHFDAVMVFVVVAVLALLGVCARRSIGRVPRGLGLLMEKFVIFIRDEMVEVAEVKEFIEAHSQIQVVQTIGHVLVLYCPAKKKEHRSYSLEVAKL